MLYICSAARSTPGSELIMSITHLNCEQACIPTLLVSMSCSSFLDRRKVNNCGTAESQCQAAAWCKNMEDSRPARNAGQKTLISHTASISFLRLQINIKIHISELGLFSGVSLVLNTTQVDHLPPNAASLKVYSEFYTSTSQMDSCTARGSSFLADYILP